jgi:hypothetical protein
VSLDGKEGWCLRFRWHVIGLEMGGKGGGMDGISVYESMFMLMR